MKKMNEQKYVEYVIFDNYTAREMHQIARGVDKANRKLGLLAFTTVICAMTVFTGINELNYKLKKLHEELEELKASKGE